MLFSTLFKDAWKRKWRVKRCGLDALDKRRRSQTSSFVDPWLRKWYTHLFACEKRARPKNAVNSDEAHEAIEYNAHESRDMVQFASQY